MKDEKRTLLIVDDAPANLQSLAGVLKEEYRILVATSGKKALEVASEDPPPDLILLDVQMPGMDGYEVCRKLKSQGQTNRIPVIFVTVRSGAEDEELGFSLGAVDYITKPFHPAVVRARVRNQINLKIRTDMLEELSMVDGLTGIPNRRRFDEDFRDEWNRSRRSGVPLSVIMMDIDNFKAYNDHYGHGAGDDCLRRVARRLAEPRGRASDLVARYGGEEFVALLPETPGDGGLHVAENLRKRVEGLHIPHEYSGTAPVVTISLGVSTGISRGEFDDGLELLKKADQALYLAKKEGRNRSRRL